jgi:hypothetical protein
MALRFSLVRHFLLIAGVVVVAACGRTAVTAGAGGWSAAPPATPIYDDTRRTIHAGEELDIRLQTALSSESATADQGFQAITAYDLRNGARVVVPAGSAVTGIIRSVQLVRFDDVGALTLGFIGLVANGNSVAIDGVVTEVFESSTGNDEGHSAAVPPPLSGGVRSGLTEDLLMRVRASDGAIVAVRQGMPARLPAGAIVRIRLTRDVTIQ